MIGTGDAVTVSPPERVRRKSNGATGAVIRRETCEGGRDFVRFDDRCKAYIDRADLEPLDDELGAALSTIGAAFGATA